jgi:hypothetical protein
MQVVCSAVRRDKPLWAVSQGAIAGGYWIAVALGIRIRKE